MPDKRKTILLVNPVGRERTGFSQDRISKIPPLALGIVAGVTPKEYHVRILDENFQAARFRPADLVGITAYTENAARAYEVAGMFRQRGVPVVMGGIHASACPEEAMQYVDAVVVGEAEKVWPQLLADFEAGAMKTMYRAEGYLEPEKIPFARHDLFHPLYHYRIIQTTRGCPYDCEFCTVTAFNGRVYRERPVEHVLDELEAHLGPYSSVVFADDNLIGNNRKQRERAISLFKGIVDRGLNIDWFSQVTIDIADDEEVLHWAAKSGCRILLVGIEAETDAGLASLNKTLNRRKGGIAYYRKAFETINRHGIAVLGTFILGLETDSLEDIRNRASFIVKSRVDAVQCSILTPFPGTRLHDRLKAAGQLAKTNFPSDWNYYRFMDLAYRHPEIPPDALAGEIEKAWRKIYNPAFLYYKFFRTWWKTRSMKAAFWAFYPNFRYRRDVLEKPVNRE